MGEIVIDVSHLSKMYKLYDKPSDRLKEALGLSKEKRYTEHYALHDVSLQVKQGETVGIIGTNGSGKSTILKIITGVLNATSGKVKVNGRISALLELGAGFNQEYTGIENIYLNGTMIGFSREEIDAKLQSILDFADIGDFVYQPVKTYSSGMFVRLAFAVAINIDPEILIVDEALSVGDVFFQTKCYKKFEEFKKMGKTILFVSHDLGSIAKYCDRVILLNKGVKKAEGVPKDIINLYKRLLVEEHNGGSDLPDIQEESSESIVSEAEIEAGKENIWKTKMLLNPTQEIYGNGKAEIVDFGIFDRNNSITNTVQKLDDFIIKIKVHFNEKIENPIFAFTIRDLKSTDLCGTNTMIEHIDTGVCKEGDNVVVSFRQTMRLQNGQYMLQLGCTGFEGDDLVVYHRLYDICCIQVISDKVTNGYFDVDSKIKIEKD